MSARLLCVLAVASLGCGAGAAAVDDTQVPPTTSAADIDAWFAKAAYKSWTCESAPHAGRGNSPHGSNRICSNAALAGATGTGEYPVGAANVKELFDAAGAQIGVAFEVKTRAGGADSWFWYEKLNGAVVANAAGLALCSGCHGGAPRDFVFTQVK